jgi:FKBP-type peptidyl-prolyl cis-trans isomerase 2
MQSGDFVHVNFIGRVKDTGEVFDLTDEEVAKKEKIHNKNVKYGPIAVIIDGGFVLKGMDDALKEMKVGDKKTISMTPDKAFGERKTELIKLIPISTFKEQNIDPTPGGYVNINNFNGRVISVDGGRVKVDFNHPLAGKSVEYELEVKDAIGTVDGKVKAVVGYFAGTRDEDVDVGLSEKIAEIKFKKPVDLHEPVKKTISDVVFKWVKDIEKVKFVDEYAK